MVAHISADHHTVAGRRPGEDPGRHESKVGFDLMFPIVAALGGYRAKGL